MAKLRIQIVTDGPTDLDSIATLEKILRGILAALATLDGTTPLSAHEGRTSLQGQFIRLEGSSDAVAQYLRSAGFAVEEDDVTNDPRGAEVGMMITLHEDDFPTLEQRFPSAW